MSANDPPADPAAVKASPLHNATKARDKASRVRDSQRASRARKRELFESLRARIAEFERRGVQATLEMQQAARAVAEENTQLRNLLALRGVSQAEVDAFLQRGEVTQAAGLAPTHSCATEPPLAGPPHPNVHSRNVAGDPAVVDASVVGEQLQAADLPSSDAASADQPPLRSMLETPCDNATAILVQVRGHESEVAIRKALGCVGPGSCVVRNTKLLQLMEEAG
ncbi:uncharacterized protein PpBr36_06546 [Pyricularia pennisetigena]|uniref:uncharacterized protein n=1 Tax=Pyricularia pennisetigena TaxID=1578925 RepID=UPI00114EE401|nr:uncharacterized protein PpBr36_06546 [Pyricularia pennisetigena]TLS23456.1 hypothetical protein PpBr36_06546 [Pyricularia pennisetigena]